MFILIDKKIPDEAKENLSAYGDLIEIESNGIVYDSISGHPDIFVCQTPTNLFVAPNTPAKILDSFKRNNIKFEAGTNPLGNNFPFTSFYNAVITDSFLIHNLKYTDEKIIDFNDFKTKINVKQSYTRCNLVAISDHVFITSDLGIFNALNKIPLVKILFVKPDQIVLPGFRNGFFGGCCGVIDNNLFVIGNLNRIEDGETIKSFLKESNVNLIELYNNQLFDGGSIFFLREH